MKLLPPIKTPHGDIKLFEDDGTLFVSQGDLNEAMGYNRFLGTNARLPKILDTTKSRKRFGNTYCIDLKNLVEKVFPIFLDGYLSSVRQSTSRQQFFGNPVETIWRQSKSIVKTLEETLMCYDPNSYPAKLGELGERIIRQRRRTEGYNLEIHPDASPEGAHPIDLILTKSGRTSCEEIKTRALRQYQLNGIMVNAFQIEYDQVNLKGFALNKRYAERNNLRLTLTVINLIDKKIYSSDTLYLEKKTTIDGIEFPFYDKQNGYVYFHPNQFQAVHLLTEEERAQFEHLNLFRELPPETTKKETTATHNTPQKKKLTQKEITDSFPEVTLNYIDFPAIYSEAACQTVNFKTCTNNAGEIFFRFLHVVKALGYSGKFNLCNSSFTQTFLPFNPFVKDKYSKQIFINAQILIDKALPCFSAAHFEHIPEKTVRAQRLAPILADKIRDSLSKLGIDLSAPARDEKQICKSEEQTMILDMAKTNAADYQIDMHAVSSVDIVKKSDTDILAQAATIFGVTSNDLIQLGLTKSEENFRKTQSQLKKLLSKD